MACEDLLKRMGFGCEQRQGGFYVVETPMSFPDGEAINFYLREHESAVLLSDNADTLFHLRNVGMDVSDRKRWRGVRQIVSAFGMNLDERGEITGEAAPIGTQNLVSRYIGAMLAISDMEREFLGISEELANFINEVELHLRAWKPKEELTHRPAVVGHSGRTHYFHFRQAGDLIDAARPNSIRTGSILRKAADIQNTKAPLKIMVVMDDRDYPEKAAAETDILSTLVSVLPFSRLARNLSGGAQPTH